MPKTIFQYTTVLIVDSDPIRKKIYTHIFEKNKNFIYHLTDSADDLTEQLKRKKIDILVMYLQCITPNEIEFLRKIKTENPQTRIVLITKPTNSKEIFKQSESEIDNYLFTPFSSDDLSATIRNLI